MALLNEYKYTLTRRRLLQTLTGGIKIQSLPVPLHLLQWTLWWFPLVLSLPFIATGNLWNMYYIGLVYSVLCALVTLFVGAAVKIVYWKTNYRTSDHDEEQESVTIENSFSVTSLALIFPAKHWMDIFIHALFSGLTCYATVSVSNVFIMKEVVSVVAVPFIITAGAITLCTSHYSLLVRPPYELSLYRVTHHDKLHLYYLRRPFYVVLVGISFVLLRSLANDGLLIIPYIVHSLLPLLWTLGILPPADALLFWFLEQVNVHLMGGSQASSEIRILLHFFVAFVPTILAAVFISDRLTLSLVAAGLGFLLSQNLLHLLVLGIFSVLKQIYNRQHQSKAAKCYNRSYTSYYGLDFRPISTRSQKTVFIMFGCFRTMLLLGVTLIIVVWTFGRGSGSPLRDRVSTAASYAIIGVCVLVRVLMTFSGAFMCFGLVRNPFYPKSIDNLKKFKQRKTALLCLSIPSQLLSLYAWVFVVLPVLMVTFVSLLLDMNSKPASTIWCGITTIRLFRKIWQNTWSSSTDLTIVSILYLSLPSHSAWFDLGLGEQALIVSIVIQLAWNILTRLKSFLLIVISFLDTCSDTQSSAVFIKAFLPTLILLPVTLWSLILSAVFSAPLFPIFTLPVFLLSFPRPGIFWPSFFDPKSLSQTYESSYYKQAIPTISESISRVLATGICHPSIVPGATWFLIRFQDRLCLVKMMEKGYGYCLIQIHGLELQETSCHTTEAMSIDDINNTMCISNETSKVFKCFSRYPLYLYQPLDIAVGLVFSDAQNSLTGIIDRPDSLRRFSENLYKVLAWVFVRYAEKKNDNFVRLPSGTLSINSNYLQNTNPADEVLLSQSQQSYRLSRIFPVTNSALLPMTTPLSMTELSRIPIAFPNEWLEHILTIYGSSIESNFLQVLIKSCFSLIDVPASNAVFRFTSMSSQTKPGHLYRGFRGEFPRLLGAHANRCITWFNDNKIVKELSIRAYRYTVKLLYDEVVLGDINNKGELLETLKEYDSNWFVGPEEAEDWQRNVIAETRSLFSIGSTENVYTAHVLTLQDEAVFLGQLDQAVIEGIWSNLSFELQYLTNDDDERYSIQAQVRILRNIITQGAEFPYGYQIFSSDLIMIPSI